MKVRVWLSSVRRFSPHVGMSALPATPKSLVQSYYIESFANRHHFIVLTENECVFGGNSSILIKFTA